MFSSESTESFGLERHIFDAVVISVPYEDGDGPSKHPIVEPEYQLGFMSCFRMGKKALITYQGPLSMPFYSFSEEGHKCKNAVLHACYFLCAVLGVFMAIILAISIVIVLFTAWFPQLIKHIPKVPHPPEPTNPPGVLSPWGRPLDQPCDLLRLDLMWNDCGIGMRWCREEVKKYEKEGSGEEERFWNITRTCFEAAVSGIQKAWDSGDSRVLGILGF